jgi:PBP1b-binding outer membrane lipoprotein LpoB
MKTKKKKLTVLFSLLILSSFVLYSCYPDYGLATSDYDTVITLYDNSADFNKPTYAMPDSVVHFVEEGEEDNIDRSKDALILSTIENNMTRLGYERVPVDTSAAAPGFALLVGVTTAENYRTVWYPGWGYWGGWGWWGGYPGYGYGGSYTYSYTTGTIFMTMLDPNKVNSENKFVAVWAARLNGVLSNSLNTNQIITQRINDAFNQSPYLGAN